MIPLMPPQASQQAVAIDTLSTSFMALVTLLALPVFILMLVFTIRYRRGRKADRRNPPMGNDALEIAWAVIPFLLVIGFFVWSSQIFFRLQRPPTDAFLIHVVAKQWMWKFQHPEGAREIGDLHVPVGVPIRLEMTSQDVIHSLYVPALRLKQDVLPGRYTVMWFTITQPGTYPIRCAEFCGTNHSEMGGNLIALPQQDYARWLARANVDDNLAAQGEALFQRLGCSGCHASGSTVHAPPLAGLYGSPVPLSDGRVVVANDQYIHDSILLPNQDIAAGYPPIMPTFANIVSEEQVAALEAYIRSLATAPGGERPNPPPTGSGR